MKSWKSYTVITCSFNMVLRLIIRTINFFFKNCRNLSISASLSTFSTIEAVPCSNYQSHLATKSHWNFLNHVLNYLFLGWHKLIDGTKSEFSAPSSASIDGSRDLTSSRDMQWEPPEPKLLGPDRSILDGSRGHRSGSWFWGENRTVKSDRLNFVLIFF